MKRLSVKISSALLAIIMVLSAFLLTGCGLFNVSVTGIEFVTGESDGTLLQMSVGETVEIGKFITVLPSKATNKNYNVTASDASIVKVGTQTSAGRTRVYAEAAGVGETVLTAKTEDGGYTAQIRVSVSYAQPDFLTVEVVGQQRIVGDVVIFNQDGITPVTLVASSNNNISPDTVVTWNVSGDETAYFTACGEEFVFTPVGVGETAITACVTDSQNRVYKDTVYVNVYGANPVVTLTADGELNQNAGEYSAVRFTAECEQFGEDNPAPIIRWYVNDVESGDGETFVYTPDAAGIYKVELKVNSVSIGSKTVSVSGVIVPQNVRVDFDNCYPNVYIRWDTIPYAAGYEVRIIDANTNRPVSEDINTKNAALADKFTDSSFDASAYLTDKLFTGRYTVSVKTLASADGTLSESEYSTPYTTELISSKAKSYLASKFYDGARNRYISSFEEFYEWLEYAMLFRPESVERGEKLYLAYLFTSAVDEIEKAMDSQHFTGSYLYSASQSISSRRECTFTIEFETDGAPSTRINGVHTGEAWNALRPHVNYDLSKARPAKYVFPIDSRTPVSVSTSDQLYYLAQLGYKPVPVSGSAAEKLYNYARRTLRYIITDDMTDAEKVHAIYDWIMWRVTYDHEVLYVTDLYSAVKYESYYLESVFTDYYYYGVCDAMSKAFVLMCQIEGIDSMRVTGIAGTYGNVGGHAWNKVKVDGQWYICDCTWGDVSIQIMTNGAYRESASHMYFLVTDEMVADTHFEDENINFPKTASERYPWYDEDIEYENSTVDFYLDGKISTAQFQAELDKLVGYMTEKVSADDRSFTVGPDSLNTTSSNYYGFEIVSDGKWGGQSRTSALRANLESSLKKRGMVNGSNYYLNITEVGSEVHTLIFFKKS